LIPIEPALTDFETNLRKQLKLICKLAHEYVEIGAADMKIMFIKINCIFFTDGFASVAVVATLIQFIQYVYLQDHFFKHNGPYGCLAKVALATSLSCMGPVIFIKEG